MKLPRFRIYNQPILKTGPGDTRTVAQRTPWPAYGRLQEVDGAGRRHEPRVNHHLLARRHHHRLERRAERRRRRRQPVEGNGQDAAGRLRTEEAQRQRGADAPRRYGEYCDWLRETLGAIDRIGYCHDRTAALLLLSSPKGHRT